MGKKIDTTIPPQEWEMMKYSTFPSSYSRQEKREKLDLLINSNSMIFSEKYDGNLCRFIAEDGDILCQTRTISKQTGQYGELQNKIAYIDDFKNKFEQLTVFLGEIYLPGKTSKEIGTILRCKEEKALERQKGNPIFIYIFDVLVYEGQYLTETPIVERIKYLPLICQKINNPQVSYAKYYPAEPDVFYPRIEQIFNRGGEGVVLYRKDFLPCAGRSSMWDTVKVKQELNGDVDVFISGTAAGDKEYKGKELPTWTLWQNTRTGELVRGNYYTEYSQGGCYEPVSKTYFFGLPGSIECSVYDEEGNAKVLCYCSNLTDEFRCALRDHLDDYIGRPARISAMMVSETVSKSGEPQYSLRHPKFLELRDDIEKEDCLLSKIIGG